MTGNSLGVTLRIIGCHFANYLAQLFARYLALWLFRLVNRKRAPFYRTLDAISAKNVRLELCGNSAENGEGFRGQGVKRKSENCKKFSKR